MALELGPFSNNAAARIDLGNVTIPTNVTYFVWSYRNGEGGANFGRIFGRGGGVHDIISNNQNVANTYAFGNISGSQYYYWTRPDARQWASISISGNTADSATAPTIYQNGIKPSLTRVGASSFWGTLTSTSTNIGNRPSDWARVWDGMLAHFCMWDVSLSDSEHEALHAGAIPNTIRPESIVRYFPLLNDERNLSGANGTNVSCLFSNLNPPVFDLNDTPVDLFYVSAGGAVSLIINNLAQSHSLATADLTQQNTLSMNSLLQEQFMSAVNLVQSNNLSVADNSQAHGVDGVLLSQSTQITPNNLSHSHLLDSQVLSGVQLLRPVANILQQGWTGGYADVDEVSANDSDFAYSVNNSVSALELDLTDPPTPGAGIKTIRYRIARTNNGTVDSAGFAPRITAYLYQGTELIASDVARTPDGTWTTYSWTPDTSLVTGWADLKLRFETEISGPAGAYGSAAYRVTSLVGSYEATWTAGSAANYSAAVIAFPGYSYRAPSVTSEPASSSVVTPIPESDKFYKTVGADTLFLRLLQSQSVYVADTNITKAIIAIHGATRNANTTFANGNALAGGASNIIVMAPQFIRDTSTTPAPEADQLAWGSSWPQGGRSVDTLPFRISSHQIVEDLITHLRATFVNLNLVYIVGHSAGGQFAQRFAMTNNDPDRIRILCCNPSSYAYPDIHRWDGTAYTDPGIITCPTYNDWKYGLSNLASVSYVNSIGAVALKSRLEASNVLYLAGANDNVADSFLDTTCPAAAQGANRLERAVRYYGYLGQVYGSGIYSRHHFNIVANVGHTSWAMLTSPQAQDWVLNDTVPAQGVPKLVNQSVGMNAVDATSLSLTVSHVSTLGNGLIATVALRTDNATQVASVTDTASNVWIKGVSSNPGTGSSTRTEIWFCLNANPITSATVTITGTTPIRMAALISEFYGVANINNIMSTAAKSESSVISAETATAYSFVPGALMIGSVNSSTFGDRRSIDAGSNFIALKDYSAPTSSTSTRGVGLSWTEMVIPAPDDFSESLIIKNLSQVNSLENISLTQSNILSLLNLAQSHDLETSLLDQNSYLSVADLEQAHGIPNFVLEVGMMLAMGNIFHDHIISSPSLAVGYELSINSILQTHTLSHVDISTETLQLVINDLAKSQSLQSVSLTEQAALNVFSLTHNQNLSVAYFGVISTPSNRIYSVKKHDRNYAVLANDRIIVIN